MGYRNSEGEKGIGSEEEVIFYFFSYLKGAIFLANFNNYTYKLHRKVYKVYSQSIQQ
jgi:hypothetical protein